MSSPALTVVRVDPRDAVPDVCTALQCGTRVGTHTAGGSGRVDRSGSTLTGRRATSTSPPAPHGSRRGSTTCAPVRTARIIDSETAPVDRPSRPCRLVPPRRPMLPEPPAVPAVVPSTGGHRRVVATGRRLLGPVSDPGADDDRSCRTGSRSPGESAGGPPWAGGRGPRVAVSCRRRLAGPMAATLTGPPGAGPAGQPDRPGKEWTRPASTLSNPCGRGCRAAARCARTSR